MTDDLDPDFLEWLLSTNEVCFAVSNSFDEFWEKKKRTLLYRVQEAAPELAALYNSIVDL